jgi:hypothetical protein
MTPDASWPVRILVLGARSAEPQVGEWCLELATGKVVRGGADSRRST